MTTNAVESPLVAEEVVHQPFVGRCGNAVNFVEGAHDGAHAGINGRFIGGKVFVVHADAAHVGGVVIAACLLRPIKSKMLHTGDHGVVGRQVFSLVSFHHGFCDPRSQEGVFTRSFGNTPPAGITRNVDHRRESPENSVGGSFLSCHTGALFHQSHIPGGRNSQRYGKGRPVAVDHIHADDQRNLHAALLHGNALHLSDFFERPDVEESADFPFPDLLGNAGTLGLTGGNVTRGRQVQLPQLFFQSHLF